VGWLLAFGLLLTSLFGGYTNHAKSKKNLLSNKFSSIFFKFPYNLKDARRMETFEYALFFSMTRFTWPLSVAWIIYACHYGYGGEITHF
jgi:hypothetical protein